MVLSRKLEERLIQVYKKGEAYFWIGAPGEEAFGVALGMQVKKGQGPEYDYLHLHYRATPTLIAVGMDVRDSLRLIMNRATDPSTRGRNFSNHYCFPKWNVVPVSSPIEVQYAFAIGTGIAQRRRNTDSVSIVTGGDAGTAEGDFASSLIWATRPGFELPLYLTVQNNRWGISTAYEGQHGEVRISDRGKAFGMRTGTYNGNDPIEAYKAIQDDLNYIRKQRRPVLSEFYVSRLYGHSSASGANRVQGEECCITTFEEKLLRAGYITSKAVKELHEKYEEQLKVAADEVRKEAAPTGDTIWEHFYADGENGDWRKF
jgi:2-oxoisovalerate dehydrogenase E1 component alpha subunit